MAVQPKHSDHPAHYDVPDMTNEQRHRFTSVANKAQVRKEQLEERPTMIETAKRAAFKPVVQPRPNKINRVRYAIWLCTFLAVCLWLMYMSG
ncbi:hypothetical protein [Vibrio navarrensis]|uniref:hypothetical protein n=1 Tax=Vibrio navarrensis TaxID=29495 RepID=UPI00051CCCA1|nr:hypothetical protein [Vibrio navarrensis]KGK14115.1 hypothetical protein EA24_13745 [Vibrio navarrensis]